MSKKLSFETQLQSLEHIVTALEKGNIPLEQAMKQFEQGMRLARQCQKTLTDAQHKMEKLLASHELNTLLPDADDDHSL